MMTREIILKRLPFITLLKLGLIGATFSALLLLLFMAVLQLFVTFPPDPSADAPSGVKAMMWFIYLVVGPVIAALGFALSCWLGTAILSRMRLVQFRVEIAQQDEEKA